MQGREAGVFPPSPSNFDRCDCEPMKLDRDDIDGQPKGFQNFLLLCQSLRQFPFAKNLKCLPRKRCGAKSHHAMRAVKRGSNFSAPMGQLKS